MYGGAHKDHPPGELLTSMSGVCAFLFWPLLPRLRASSCGKTALAPPNRVILETGDLDHDGMLQVKIA